MCELTSEPQTAGQLPSPQQPVVLVAFDTQLAAAPAAQVQECCVEPAPADSSGLYLELRVLRI